MTEAPSGVAAALNLQEEEDSKGQIEENELKERQEAETSSNPPVNEFEHFDVVSIFVSIVKTPKILTYMLIITT